MYKILYILFIYLKNLITLLQFALHRWYLGNFTNFSIIPIFLNNDFGLQKNNVL